MPCMPEVASKGTILKKLDFLLSDHHKRVAMLPDLQSGYYPPLTPTPGAALMPLTKIANDHGAGLTASEVAHIDGNWFGLIPVPPVWWPCAVDTHSPGTLSGVEEIVREGIIQTILKAEELQVPVSCFWFCHLQHFHELEHEGGSEEPPTGKHPSEEAIQALIRAIHDAASNLDVSLADACISIDTYQHVEATVCWSLEQVTLLLHTPGPPHWAPQMAGPMDIPDPIKVVKHQNPNPGSSIVVIDVMHMHTVP